MNWLDIVLQRPKVEGNLAYIKEHTFEGLPGHIPQATKKCKSHVTCPTSAKFHSHKMKNIDSAPKISSIWKEIFLGNLKNITP